MDHVTILSKEGFLDMILAGEKTIESRWYRTRRSPWDRISRGDTVYFKESGELVSAKATAARVLQFSALTKPKVRELLSQYNDRIRLRSSQNLSWADGKRYCILIFLENVKPIEPFSIDKTGFGMQSAWISVPNIRNIRS